MGKKKVSKKSATVHAAATTAPMVYTSSSLPQESTAPPSPAVASESTPAPTTIEHTYRRTHRRAATTETPSSASAPITVPTATEPSPRRTLRCSAETEPSPSAVGKHRKTKPPTSDPDTGTSVSPVATASASPPRIFGSPPPSDSPREEAPTSAPPEVATPSPSPPPQEAPISEPPPSPAPSKPLSPADDAASDSSATASLPATSISHRTRSQTIQVGTLPVSPRHLHHHPLLAQSQHQYVAHMSGSRRSGLLRRYVNALSGMLIAF
ncbi:hypothetical protein C2S51_009178 [Perilla frutescens var. frutescens]|nr:hypothetical protein C2S51_009178 [Perilla frutescens var. frutescens]